MAHTEQMMVSKRSHNLQKARGPLAGAPQDAKIPLPARGRGIRKCSRYGTTIALPAVENGRCYLLKSDH